MLSDRQKKMIDLAGETFKYAGSLEQEAQLSPIRYWQEVNMLLRTAAAGAYRPALLSRLNNRRRPNVRTASRLLG